MKITVNFEDFVEYTVRNECLVFLVFPLCSHEWSILLSVMFNLNSSIAPHKLSKLGPIIRHTVRNFEFFFYFCFIGIFLKKWTKFTPFLMKTKILALSM
jgi:hypothetical protein